MSISVPALAALLTRRVADDLAALVRHTPDDRLSWKPDAAARPIIDQIKECAIVNLCWAVNVRERGCAVGSDVSPDVTAFMLGLQDTKEGCLAALEQSAAQLIAAINGVSDGETGQRINIDPFNGGTMTLAESCFYAYWNMVYHEGQVNYLQTLYGDRAQYHAYHVQPA